MEPDLTKLYTMMYKSRLFEEEISELWEQGLISGEMHLGTGEEAIIAGIISQLHSDDALALDHRGTAALLMAGVDPYLIIRELLGQTDGLCGGQGGHMHLFSKDHIAASSGIVGAAGPTAIGFALAAQYLRPGSVCVAFFGEGAMNQGMLMESLNLASVWKLPVIFVCKDDQWSITTPSLKMTGGDVCERAKAMGINAISVDGRDVLAVWHAASVAISKARAGQGPTFLRASCVHLEGHFLGYPLMRIVRDPLKELPSIILALLQTFFQRGAKFIERIDGLRIILHSILATLRDPRRDNSNDPIDILKAMLNDKNENITVIEMNIKQQVTKTIAAVMKGGIV